MSKNNKKRLQSQATPENESELNQNGQPGQEPEQGEGTEQEETTEEQTEQEEVEETTESEANSDVEAIATEAFEANPHAQKVWIDEAKKEWHLVKRHGLIEVERP